VKVEQEADGDAAHAELGLELGAMGPHQFGNRFYFEDDRLVPGMSARNPSGMWLPLQRTGIGTCAVRQAGALQFEAETRGVDRFQQARTGSAMHLDRQPDDAVRQRFMLQLCSAVLGGRSAFSVPNVNEG
jgi:hypothetical protein